VQGGEYDVDQTIVLGADGAFAADQAEAYALSIPAGVRQLDAGLDGTPGGIPAALATLPEPWPRPGSDGGEHHPGERGPPACACRWIVVTVPEVAVCGVVAALAFVAGYFTGRRPPRHSRQTWPPQRRR
jgi:hypothetical protein